MDTPSFCCETPSLEEESLASIKTGQPYIISTLKGSREICQKLREYGICEHTPIIKIKNGKNVLCLISGIRMALNENLAHCIYVSSQEHSSPL